MWALLSIRGAGRPKMGKISTMSSTQNAGQNFRPPVSATTTGHVLSDRPVIVLLHQLRGWCLTEENER